MRKVSVLASPSERANAVPRSGIRAIFELARGVWNSVHLERGEPAFRIPDHVTEACIQALKEGFTSTKCSLG